MSETQTGCVNTNTNSQRVCERQCSGVCKEKSRAQQVRAAIARSESGGYVVTVADVAVVITAATLADAMAEAYRFIGAGVGA